MKKNSPIIPFLKGDEDKSNVKMSIYGISNKVFNKLLSHLGISSLKPKGRGQQMGFTLVELIVVITILAILGTIAFISLQGYSRDARNATRTSDMANIQKVLVLYQTVSGEFPEPTNPQQVTYSGSEVWTQGTFGEDTRRKLGTKGNISYVPLDPLTNNEYTYSVLNTKKEMQLAGVYEGDIALNITNTTYAAGEYGTTKIIGNYNGKVAKTKTGSTIYVLAVPSIINGEKTLDSTIDLIDIINMKKLAFNHSNILPTSYDGVVQFSEKLPTDNIVNTGSLVVYQTNNLNDLKDETEQQNFITALQQAYSGTTVKDTPNIKSITDSSSNGNELYLAQTLINNYVNHSVKVTAQNNGGSNGGNGGNQGGDHYNIYCNITQDPNAIAEFTYVTGSLDVAGSGVYVQSTTCKKWQAHSGPSKPWAKDCSTSSIDDNYCGDYKATWNGTSYDYEYSSGGQESDFEAHKYCESLGSGWRLPTKRELFSIMTDVKPSGMSYYTKLPSISTPYYWSSTVNATHTNNAWYGNFSHGYLGNYTKNNNLYTICIHD